MAEAAEEVAAVRHQDIKTVIIILFPIWLSAINSHGADDGNYKSIAPVLNSAEKFFVSLKNNEFETAWSLLSEKSHEMIIDDVYEAAKKINRNIKIEEIIQDFNGRGVMFNSYWKAFHGTFDTEMLLEQSRWEECVVTGEKAEIIITYNKSQDPARLKMFKEKDTWKVGLVETFWTRRTAKVLHYIF